MERLEFGEGSHYSPLEASIHLSRYLSAKPYCQGRKVLDIACGEGYGSRLLAQWGADAVTGVDISEDAIKKATANFSSPTVRFIQASGEGLLSALGGEKFDLIVSLETVEHVDDPALFLANLKSLLAPGGVMVISCPNDSWYFADGGSNPYHKHRWTSDEFKQFAEGVLGPASWAYGTFGVGFAVYAEGGTIKVLGESAHQEEMLNSQSMEHSVLTHMSAGSASSPSDVSFFLGVWGASAPDATFAGYPVSMDLTKTLQLSRDDANGYFAAVEQLRSTIETERSALQEQQEAMKRLSADLMTAQDALFAADRDNRQRMMLYRVAQEEAELFRGQLGHHQYLLANATGEREALRSDLGHHQYLLANATSEREALRSDLGDHQYLLATTQAELALAREQLASVPWRVVRIWWRIRRFVPQSVLKATASAAHAIRGGRR